MSDGNRRKENKIIDGCEEERKADDSENVDSKDDLVGDTTDYISAEELQFLSKANSPINNISNNSNNSGGDGKIPIAENQALANTASLLSDEVSDDDQLYHEKNPEDVENAEIDEEDGKENQLVEEVEVRPLLPKRHVLLLMIFLGFAVVYSLRVNINVAIVAMVNNRTSITRSGKISVHVSFSHVVIFLFMLSCDIFRRNSFSSTLDFRTPCSLFFTTGGLEEIHQIYPFVFT